MMLEHYGADVGVRHARKHIGWYLDRHSPDLTPQAKAAIMTSKDTEFVTDAIEQALSSSHDVTTRQEAA